MISYGRQNITQEDIDEVIKVLQSKFITQGPVIPQFENAILKIVGSTHAVSTNSATSSLHIACLSLGLGEGDILWTSPNSFVSSANCGLFCGAEVDFVDIDPLTWNISVDKLKEKLKKAEHENKLPKVIVTVDFAGQPVEQELIWELAKEYNFKILEDASHALGASRCNELVGSNRWSDITVFSFHAVKMITTGEGGVALTNSDELADKMRLLRSHGITKNTKQMNTDISLPDWYYEQQQLGFNYRLTDIQAALGLSQLSRLNQYVNARQYLASRYDAHLNNLPIQLPHIKAKNQSSWHIYVIRLINNARGNDLRKDLYDALKDAGICANVHYMPIHLQPYYKLQGFNEGDFQESERHGKEAITLPLYPGLDENLQDLVISIIKKLLKC